MAQTKITSKSLATNTIAAANIADNAIESRHLTSTLFSPNIFSDKINVSTGYFSLPAGTTAQRPTSPPNGSVRFNTDLGVYEWYDSVSTLWLNYGTIRPAYATGGTITTIFDPYDGFSYRVHTFTTPGNASMAFSRSGSVEFLIVGGGGSGGNHSTTNANGGGGGGGVVYKKNHLVAASTYTVTVGGGAAGLTFQQALNGFKGGNSSFVGSFTNYIAAGGGGGASTSGNTNGSNENLNGGCGGGSAHDGYRGGHSNQIKYPDAITYGNSGGKTTVGWTGGGGGGAGSIGSNGGSGAGGDGGFGISSPISGTVKYYAGGGGGGGNSTEQAGSGWHGGGRGFGAVSRYYTNLNYPVEINSTTLGGGTPDGIDGTGGGGGGGSYWSNNSTNWLNKGSGSGGDGIVIIRYRV